MGSLRLLVVEPDAETRQFVTRVARELPAETIDVTDGPAALLAFGDARPDVVVAASPLPQLGTPELITLLKGRAPDRLPILVLGSEASSEDRFRCFHQGADDFLDKPLEETELRDRLRAFSRIVELGRQMADQLAEIDELGSLDSATETHGRRYLHRQLDHEWARAERYGEALSLVLVDVGGVSGNLGAESAENRNAFLLEASRRMKSSLRRCDLTARVGFSQFMVVMPNTSTVGAYFAAEKIRNLIGLQEFSHGPATARLAAAIGVTTYQDANFEEPDQLYDSAVEALAKAHEKGPGSVVLFRPVAAAS